eukprot:14459-Heterococcus_DN1.PRE.7
MSALIAPIAAYGLHAHRQHPHLPPIEKVVKTSTVGQVAVVATLGVFALLSYNYKRTAPEELAVCRRVTALTPWPSDFKEQQKQQQQQQQSQQQRKQNQNSSKSTCDSATAVQACSSHRCSSSSNSSSAVAAAWYYRDGICVAHEDVDMHSVLAVGYTWQLRVEFSDVYIS